LHDIIVFTRRGSQGKSAPLMSASVDTAPSTAGRLNSHATGRERSPRASQVPSPLHDTGAFR